MARKKTGGRQKGTLNRRTDELLDLMNEFSYNPVRSLLQKYPNLSISEQLKIDLKLTEHTYPKIKEQEFVPVVVKEDPFDSMTEDELRTFVNDISDYFEKSER